VSSGVLARRTDERREETDEEKENAQEREDEEKGDGAMKKQRE